MNMLTPEQQAVFTEVFLRRQALGMSLGETEDQRLDRQAVDAFVAWAAAKGWPPGWAPDTGHAEIAEAVLAAAIEITEDGPE